MSEPFVSVVMPVRNGLPFLEASIASILGQTLRDFEFIILDDNSSDRSLELLRARERADKRIRVFSSGQQLGLARSSNAVVAEARAPLIARMDADDLSEPERLERQLRVMLENPDIAVVGTLCDGVDEQGKQVRPRDRSRLVRRSAFPPFPHGSVMMRRRVFDRAGGYRARFNGHEDQDLFRRMARIGSVVTLPEVLYHYRYHLQSATAQNSFSGDRSLAARTHDVDALYTAAVMRLWAGHRPEILKPLVKATSPNWMKKLLVTGWAMWADAHPSSLRASARTIIRARDLLAGARINDGGIYEWHCE